MSDVPGRQKVPYSQQKVASPGTKRRYYTEAIPMEGLCSATVDQHCVGLVDYDAQQYFFEDLASLLRGNDYLQLNKGFQVRLVGTIVIVTQHDSIVLILHLVDNP